MGFLGKIREIIKAVQGSISGIQLGNISPHIPPKILYIGAGTVILLLLCFLALVWAVNRGAGSDQAAAEALAGSFADLAIPPDELFWPSEPDFVPPVQLNRLPRGTLENTEKDIPYWIDPGEEYADRWREHIGSAVDELMEKAP
jgi:hypothetical protein